jgi:hypothetical protein
VNTLVLIPARKSLRCAGFIAGRCLSDSNGFFLRRMTLPSWTATPVGVPPRGPRGGWGCRRRVWKGLCRPRGKSIPSRPRRGRLDQFSQFLPPAASRRDVGGGRAG